jgi:curved DNA-binding protein CbpA
MPSTREHALEVLGLEEGASEEDIIQAHRRLIQKCHPDKGGSEYLAVQLNKAKDILIS